MSENILLKLKLNFIQFIFNLSLYICMGFFMNNCYVNAIHFFKVMFYINIFVNCVSIMYTFTIL